MMRAALLALVCVAGLACAPPSQAQAASRAAQYHEIVDGVRALAAVHLGRRKSQVEIGSSLFEQGLTDKTLVVLVADIQQEFGVVLPADVLSRARSTGVRAFSVRQLADMVYRQMDARL